MAETALEHRIAQIIEPALAGMSYELVRVQLSGRRGRTLQIMAERADRAPMTVDDCAEVAQTVSPLLDVEDPISGAYELEVSSPGIDRPLVRPADYERFAGYEAKLETRVSFDGRRRFRGRLRGLEEGRVRIDLADGGEAALPVESIDKAKLVLTDDLIAGALHARKARDLRFS